MFDWVTLLYSRNGHNIVNQIYFNLKKKKERKKEKERKERKPTKPELTF